MERNNPMRKSRFIKIAVSCIAAVFALSNVRVFTASAAENYFTAESGVLNIDEVEPDHRLVTVRLKAARAMTIHSLHGYFTPITGEDTELERYMSWMDYSSGISGLCYAYSDGEFDWNTADCPDDVVGDEGIHVQAGDTLIYVTFEVKDDVEYMRRSMPVKVELAVIDDGRHVQNVTLDAYVSAGHSLNVGKNVTGHGSLDAPSTAVAGSDVEVGIVPEPGYALTYLQLYGQDVTDQVKNGVYIMTVGERSPSLYATFQRAYPVLEGDGGEHIIGSDETLVFKIDNDLTEFCDQGLLLIDDEYIDMASECHVDPENQTVTLSAEFLNTLGLGEHSFYAWFSVPETGFSQASFKIVEEYIPVPNTGAFTGEGGNAKIAIDCAVITMIIGTLSGTIVLVKRKVSRK